MTVEEASAEHPQGVEAFVVGIFACSPSVAADIVQHCRFRDFPSHAIVLRQGDRVSLAYLLLLGRAQALLYSTEGQTLLIHEYGPGDLFGALGELGPVPQDADVVAVENLRTLVMETTELARLAEKHGAIGLSLARMLMQRLRQTTARMYERAALSAVGRVYAELLREARRATDFKISPAPVIAEIALRVSTTRETASRAVSALERRGIIRRDAASLTVVAPHRLEEMVI